MNEGFPLLSPFLVTAERQQGRFSEPFNGFLKKGRDLETVQGFSGDGCILHIFRAKTTFRFGRMSKIWLSHNKPKLFQHLNLKVGHFNSFTKSRIRTIHNHTLQFRNPWTLDENSSGVLIFSCTALWSGP